MSHIAEEYAKSLGVRIGSPVLSTHFYPVLPDKFITFHTNFKKVPSRHYDYWPVALKLIKEHFKTPEIKIIQVGGAEDPPFEECDHITLGASFRQMGYILEKSMLHLGIDSLPVHMASAVDIPIVALYSNIFPECSEPLWNTKSRIRHLSPDFSKIKPSFSLNESPKRVNEIPPEDIASSVLDLLEIPHDLSQYQTLKLGIHYPNKILEAVPDSMPPENFSPTQVVNLRSDLHLDTNILPSWLQYDVNIMASRQMPLNLLAHYKSKIKGVTLFMENAEIGPKSPDSESSTPQLTEDYIRRINKIGLNTSLICRKKKRISDIRLKFFDWAVEEFKKPTKKDIDFEEKICDNTFYHSNKTLISKQKEYYSTAAWKAGIDKSSDTLKLIDSEDFWEELEHLNIYNYEPKRKTQKNTSG